MGGDEAEEIGPLAARLAALHLLSPFKLFTRATLLIPGNCYGCFLLSPSQELPPLKKQAVVLEVLCLDLRLVN